jgi:hypothetical protein
MENQYLTNKTPINPDTFKVKNHEDNKETILREVQMNTLMYHLKI